MNGLKRAHDLLIDAGYDHDTIFTCRCLLAGHYRKLWKQSTSRLKHVFRWMQNKENRTDFKRS